MGSIARSGTWDEASSPAATRLARRFEDAWRDPRRTRQARPDPSDFLPEAGGDAPPAAWLALLRADLNLRWDEGESVRVEEYRARFPGLDAETMVALCYEEFCRREEDGQAPFPAEYDERFPDLTDRLRRVFDIHELVGNASSTDLHVTGADPTPFPEAGQTIAGFYLVKELGRGSFARVFLSRERQLADRPVALKVARTGSREPQTLARLQHTHIVPVHSYRTDPATGLHLLCMPYLGRITLARLLADPSARVARSGADLLAALDRLAMAASEGSSPVVSGSRTATLAPGGLGTVRGADPTRKAAIASVEAGISGTRATFAGLAFARAIAWWGSRLAEALAHAHERGVLHRDIKPTNVLLTGDGMPMLLDFNLAGEPWADRREFEPDNLGGTLAYMAPEHLEAVSIGGDDRLDARADVFSMGVLLFEALTGSRPFPSPRGNSVSGALRRAADDRRREPPAICREHPEVPASMERVIRRCLQPDPADRYPTASELAADLQAVADDSPLKWTREPLHVRAVRRARRSWKRAILAALCVGSAVGLAMSYLRDERDRIRVSTTASTLLDEGKQSLRRDDFVTGSARFEEVIRLTSGHPELHEINLRATALKAEARITEQVRGEVDALCRAATALRYCLIGVEDNPDEIEGELRRVLASFRVLEDFEWARRPELTFLDPGRKVQLIHDVDEVLFLFAASLDPGDRRASRRGVELCDLGLMFTDDREPWVALRNRLDDRVVVPVEHDLRAQRSAKSCFEWAVLLDKQGRPGSSSAWLARAVRIEPDNSWYQYHLATLRARGGDAVGSLAHYEAAIALEPANRRFRLDRAAALRSVGEWARAEEDEERARVPSTPFRPR